MPTSRAIARHRRRTARVLCPLALYSAAVVLLTVAEYGVWRYIRAKGVIITGDEPHYLILARALTHLTVHVLPAYAQDFRTHYFYAWPHGATIHTPNLTHTYVGPHGVVSAHAPGVALILAPFLAVGGKTLALCGLFAVEAAGFAYIHWRGSILVGLSVRARLVFALALAGPAIWLAGTQIYPDLLAGIMLASAVLEVATVEMTGSLTLLGALVGGGTVAFAPWLHIKNLVPALVVALALGWTARRAGSRRHLRVAAAVVFVSLSLLAGYDLYYYGHLLGYPQPTPRVTRAGLALSLGLVFDRHQGFLVQVPAAIIGLAGMWRARRSTPLAVLSAGVVMLYILLLNGSYTEVPYGGSALAGRFEWTVVPLALIWIPSLLRALESAPARLWGLAAVVLAAGVLQVTPIVRDMHVYYNVQNPTPPWDPAAYPGWWSSYLETLFGRFYADGRVFGAPWFALPVELTVVAVGCVALARLASRRTVRRGELAGAAAAVVLLLGVLPVVLPESLPNGSLTFTAADIGGNLHGSTSGTTSPRIALQGVGSGTFTATLRYVLSGQAGSATFTLSCPLPPGSTGGAESSVPLAPGARSTTATVSCRPGIIWYQASVLPRSTLAVRSLTLSKISN